MLVVIGILIALQINNWNESRKRNDLKLDYCNQLLDDFGKDISQIQFNANRLDLNINALESYREKLETPNLPLDSIYRQLKKIDLASHRADFCFQTFNTLESTGDLKLFDAKIRNALMALNSLQLDYLENFNRQNDLYNQLIIDNGLIFKDAYLDELERQAYLYGDVNRDIINADLLLELNHALRVKYAHEKADKIKLDNILNQIKELELFIGNEMSH